MNAIDILKRHGIRPSKGLGQNFLVDATVFDSILAASDVSSDDVVLEVGPGVGLLTSQLAERVARVVAVELDVKMLAVLEDTLAKHDNVTVVHGDILEVDAVAELCRATGLTDERALSYKVVANLPYYITSKVLRRLLSARVRPSQLTVMVQREVAQRIVAGPGDSSLLSLSVQVYGEPRLVRRVPAGAFYPRPKVDSAVLGISVYEEPLVPEESLRAFFRLTRAGFGQKRKQLHNSLANRLHYTSDQVDEALAAADIDRSARPQDLAIADWLRLVRAVEALKSDS